MKIKIDLSKIDKSKIVERKYTTKDGVEHTSKEYTLNIVPLKAPKFIGQSEQWEVIKTGFLSEDTTKEEREKGAKGNIVGDVIDYKKKTDFSDIANDIGIGADGEVYKHSEVPF